MLNFSLLYILVRVILSLFTFNKFTKYTFTIIEFESLVKSDTWCFKVDAIIN